MPNPDETDADQLEYFTGGSQSFRRKARALVNVVKKLQNEQKKERSALFTLYLHTDSIPITIQVKGYLVESEGFSLGVDAEGEEPTP